MNSEQPKSMLEDTPLDRALVAALETRPQPAVPADFAAQVAAKAALLPPRRVAGRARYGRTTAFAGLAVLLTVLFALAPHASPTISNVSFLLEMFVLLQLGALTYWLGRSNSEPY